MQHTKKSLCRFVPKIKKGLFFRLDHLILSDLGKFWKLVGLVFSENTFYKERTNLLISKDYISKHYLRKKANRDM